LLCLAKSLGGGRLGSRVALVLGYEVLEDTDIIPSITLVCRFFCSLCVQDRMHIEQKAIELDVLLLGWDTRI
jgi:hypothetical protein